MFVVYLTFDLKSALRNQYELAYEALREMGLFRVEVDLNDRQKVKPTTLTWGEFQADTLENALVHVINEAQRRLQRIGLTGELFVNGGMQSRYAANVF